MAHTWRNNENGDRLYFPGIQNLLQIGAAAVKKKTLAPWEGAGGTVRNLDSILKSRDIPLPVNFCTFKAMDFSRSHGGCQSWTIKKAEYQRTDAFELWCWARLLRIP